MEPKTYPIRSFPHPKAFRAWLQKNHAKSDGLWLRFYKKSSGKKALIYPEALDQALCFGWIDGQIKALDAQSWIHKFTPRRPKSAWSKINTGHAERLILAGQMTPAGQKQIDLARADGRWNAAYSSHRHAQPPDDFLKALEQNKKARAFFATLNRANLYAIVYRLETAKKPETRARRLQAILAMLTEGKTFHPQRKIAPAK